MSIFVEVSREIERFQYLRVISVDYKILKELLLKCSVISSIIPIFAIQNY